MELEGANKRLKDDMNRYGSKAKYEKTRKDYMPNAPAKYVMDMMFRNQNLGQGFAASTMMLLFVMIILIPWAVYEYREKRRG